MFGGLGGFGSVGSVRSNFFFLRGVEVQFNRLGLAPFWGDRVVRIHRFNQGVICLNDILSQFRRS